MARRLQKSLNPFTKAVTNLSRTEVSTLQQCSIQAVRQALGIHRIAEVSELNLSTQLQDSVKSLTLTDFIIEPRKDTTAKTFPAVSVFDNSSIILRIFSSEVELDNYPFLLMSFPSHDAMVGIYEDKETLAEVIRKAGESRVPIPENVIWRYISQICDEVMTLDESMQIEPKGFCFYRGKVLHTGLVSSTSMTELKELSTLDLYIAPEVLMHQPHTRASQAFSVGCIAYELAALKPVFSTTISDDNAMGVILTVMQLSNPPELPEPDEDEDDDQAVEYSSELQDLINRTLTRDPDDRLDLEEIQSLALFNMNIL